MVHLYWFIGLIISCLIAYEAGNRREECRHIWNVHNKNVIIVTNIRYGIAGTQLEQIVETLICENCGAILQINLTTGEKKELCSGGTPYVDKGANENNI